MSTDKPWDRPWSMDEIIDNAENWSMAGDVALLNTLKSFSENLLKNTTEVNNNLKNLSNGLEEASLRLNLAQNEFQSLRNVQFIESRVYEDDETLPAENDTALTTNAADNKKPENKDENEKNEDIRVAISKGLEVLNKYFDKVDVDVSDSEDENDFPNYVLRPRDPYIDRPLPYVIGTEDWHKHWHVGLVEDSDSDSETEKVSDTFSTSSETESDLPVTNNASQIKGTSDTSSELDFSKISNSARNSVRSATGDVFASSDSGEDQQNSVPKQDAAPISDKNFARQLAEKLDNVAVKQQKVEEPEINKRPLQPTKVSQYGDPFFDEPPPLESTPTKGLFSGGTGLFDDEDDETDGDLWSQKPVAAPAPQQKPTPKAAPRISQGLFDNESSDDDIFSTKKSQSRPFQPVKPPLLIEEPPALDETKREEKKILKPIGGVSIFGSDAIGKQLLRRTRVDSSDEEEDRSESPPKQDTIKPKSDSFDISSSGDRTTRPPKIDLFKDDDLSKSSPDEEDLFGKKPLIHGKKKAANLFEDDLPKINSDVGKSDPKTNERSTLFPQQREETTAKPKKNNLFDDDDLFKDDLFSTSSSSKFTSDLFLDEPERSDELFSPSNGSTGLFDNSTVSVLDDKNSINNNDRFGDSPVQNKTDGNGAVKSFASKLFSRSPPKDDLFGDMKTPEEDTNVPRAFKKLPVSLFDSPEESEEDDLFGNLPSQLSKIVPRTKPPPSNLFESPPKDDLFSVEQTKTDAEIPSNIEPQHSKNLFEDSVPEDVVESEVPKTNEILPDVPTQNITTDKLADGKKDSEPKQMEQQQSEDSKGEPSDNSGFQQPPTLLPRTAPQSSPDSVQPDLFSESTKTAESLAPRIESDLFFPKGSDNTIADPFEDLFGESQPPTKPSVKPRELSKNAPPAVPVSLFDPNPPPDDDNWETKSDTSEDVLVEDDNNKADLFEEPPPLPTAILDLDLKRKEEEFGENIAKSPGKVSSITEQFENVEPPPVPKPSKPATSPGKLKLNLNINVGALMPGSMPPKRREVIENEPLKGDEPTMNREEDAAIDDVETLHHVTKDRAKVPLRRRPSTRRGRKAALKNTSEDYQLGPETDDDIKISSTASPTTDLEPNITEEEGIPEISKTEALFQDASPQPSEASRDLFAEITSIKKQSSRGDLNESKSQPDLSEIAPSGVAKHSNLFGDIYTKGKSGGNDFLQSKLEITPKKELSSHRDSSESKSQQNLGEIAPSGVPKQADIYTKAESEDSLLSKLKSGESEVAPSSVPAKPGDLFSEISSDKLKFGSGPQQNKSQSAVKEAPSSEAEQTVPSSRQNTRLFDDMSPPEDKHFQDKTETKDSLFDWSLNQTEKRKTNEPEPNLFSSISSDRKKSAIGGSGNSNNRGTTPPSRLSPKLFDDMSPEKDLESKSKPKDSLFDSSLDSDDLFHASSTAKQASKLSQPKKTKPLKDDLFGDLDDDDEEDLFSSKKFTSKSVKSLAKKPLFDDPDDEDDDDIFKTSSSKRPETKVAVEKKIPKVSNVRKLENTKSDDDPLSAFLD